jgi:hypothetical protein
MESFSDTLPGTSACGLDFPKLGRNVGWNLYNYSGGSICLSDGL